MRKLQQCPGQLSFDDIGEYRTAIPGEPGHFVYRLWRGHECVYVGVTGIRRPMPITTRFRGHRSQRGRPWWRAMTRIEVASFPTGALATAEEQRQISELQPAFNKRGMRGRPRKAAVVL